MAPAGAAATATVAAVVAAVVVAVPIPQQYASLAASQGNPPQCDDVSNNAPPGDDFWQTVVAVCKAITGDGSWPSAIPDPPSEENQYQDCLDQDIVAMLHRAAAWHTRHPEGRPKVTYPSRSGTSKCQRRLYGVSVGDPTADTPPQFPVVFAAPGLESQDPTVTVDGTVLEDQSQNGVVDTGDPGIGLTPVVVLVPGEAGARTVYITVQTSFGTASGTADGPGLGSDLTQSGTATSESGAASDEPAPGTSE